MEKQLKSRFVKVKCKCGNQQAIFGSSSTEVKCLKCGNTLSYPTGGKSRIVTKIIEVLE